ncbi:uncharacterized protein LOC132714738 [Ruditapes philippinarum]|uniref:uncharacterized protein LOC132714738 n=1 Tax=Ruditapes philippinarum TaxID=129788 RepID=UPI00295A7C9D|nr:uncharacterized protein LOC132714738 [Ruditapes philippinarum]
MYYIESNISTILENTKTTIDLQYTTFQYTYTNLKTEYPSFMWDAAIGALRDDISVQIINADYFHALDTLWKDLNKDDVKLFVFLSVLAKRVLTYARQPFRDVPNNVGDGGNQTYTEIDCVELSLNIAREEIHALYIGQYTQKVLANRLKLTDIKNKINGAFQKLLSSSTWVKQGLNIAGSTMAKNMKMNFSPLKTSVRQTSNITGEKQSFLSLALELHKQKYVSEMSRLGKKVSEISMDWTSTQVYFDAHLNAIGLPTGLAIYLNEENQPFEVYSYIGMLMAQKFVRVLTGSLTGGVPPQWWGTDNTLAFTDVPQCFGQQLSKFQNMYYDIGNIMIANSAFEVIKQVYQTYSTSLNRDIPGTNIKENVLFVINTAQLFCRLKDGTHTFRLIKERINNVMTNNVDFQQMFSCPDVSSMVSNNTCSLFS